MTVIIRPGESQESLLKRFRKEVADSRILSTYRKKRWFVSKSEEKRKSKQRAVVVLGQGELSKSLTVTAHRFSAGARQKIEAAGGKAEVIAAPQASE